MMTLPVRSSDHRMPLLARKTEPELNVAVVPRPSLPAAPGKEEMFAEFHAAVIPVAMDHARRFLSKGEARDAVSDALAEVWVNWTNLTPEQRTPAYVLGAVHYHILKQLRVNKPLVSLDDAETQLSRLAIHEIDTPTRATTAGDVIDEVVDAMPPRRREVFLLVRELRYTYKEVGAMLSMSEGTVNTHMRLAADDVRAAFKRHGFRIAAGETPRLPHKTKEETDV
jgi:RNA polymerase sigma-70 factor, ECF subfamily